MVERRNAIEGLSRTELKQRASGNMGQERFEAVVRKHGLPEPEADLMAWTLLGRMVPDAKESIANLQRELDGWAAAARTHEIRSNPKLREVNAENREWLSDLIEYVRANPQIANREHGLFQAVRAFKDGLDKEGLRGQDAREAAMAALGLLDVQQGERAKLSIAAAPRLDAEYDTTQVLSTGRQNVSDLVRERAGLDRERKRREGRLERTRRKRQYHEGRISTTNRSRYGRIPRVETRGPRKGQPLAQAQPYYAQRAEVARLERAERKAKREVQSAERAADTAGGRAEGRVLAEQRALMRRSPQYAALSRKVGELRKQRRKLNKKLTSVANAPGIHDLVRQRRLAGKKGEEVGASTIKRSRAAYVGRLNKELREVEDELRSAERARRDFEHRFEDTGVFEAALAEAGSARFASSAARREVDEAVEQWEGDRRNAEPLMRAIGKWGQQVARELELPGLRSAAELLTERLAIARQIADRERRRGNDAGAEKVERQLADTERNLDLLMDEVDRRLGRENDLAGAFAHSIALREQQLQLRYSLRDPETEETAKPEMREELAGIEYALADTESVLSRDFLAQGKALTEPFGEGDSPAAGVKLTEEMRDREDELTRQWEGESFGALFEEAERRGIKVLPSDEFEDVIGKMVGEEFSLHRGTNPLMGLPKEKALRSISFPHTVDRDVEILLRLHGDVAAKRSALEAAQKLVTEGRIKLNDLKRTTDRVTPAERLLLLKTRQIEAEARKDVDEVRAAIDEHRGEMAEAKARLTKERAAGVPSLMPRGWVITLPNGQTQRLSTREMREALGERGRPAWAHIRWVRAGRKPRGRRAAAGGRRARRDSRRAGRRAGSRRADAGVDS